MLSGRKGRRLTLAFALLCAGLSLKSPLWAQTDEQRAAARSLATEGANAFQAGRYKDAVELFGKAETLVHAPPHLLFLARSHAKLGQFVKAREAYLKIIKETLPANAPAAFRDAQNAASEEVRAVEPKIASLTVTVEGAASGTEVEVLVNGTPMPAVLIGSARPIDPGDHQLEARARGFAARPERVTLAEGERKAVVLKLEATGEVAPLPAAAPAPAAAGTAPPPPSAAPPEHDQGTPPSDDKSGLRIGSYVAFGVGVLGVAAGTVFTLQSSSKRKDADAKFEDCGGETGCLASNPLAQEADDLDRDADSALTLGIVGYVVGGVGIAAGTTLFILSSGGGGETARGVEPYLGFGSAGVRGRF